MATVSRPAVRLGLPAIGPLVIAAACTVIAVVAIAALWPTSPGSSIAVPIRVAQVADAVTPSDEASVGRPSAGTELPVVVIGLGGAPVVALRGSTLERVASGALDSSGSASLRLRPAPYLVCITLPAQLHPVTQPGGAISPLGPPTAVGGWLCQPVTVGQKAPAPIMLTVAAGGAS